MTTVKTLTCDITDEYGHTFEKAFVAIREWSETSQKTYTSEKHDDHYTGEVNPDAIGYVFSYWYEKQDAIDGLPSRPWKYKVLVDEKIVYQVGVDGEFVYAIDANGQNSKVDTGERIPAHYKFEEVLNVDLTHAEAINIFSSEMEPEVKSLHAIELDLIRRNT